MNDRTRKRRTAGVRWLAVALGLLVGLCMVEGLARVYSALHPVAAPTLQRFHPFLGYSLRPNSSTDIEDRFGKRHYSTNSLGLRGRDVPREKGPRTFRIVCVGGSTTENAYVNDDDTYPAQLERMLQAHYPKASIEVLNAGLSAYSSAHLIIHFQLNLVELRPDLLIVYQAINDLMPMSYPDFKPDYRNFYTSYHLRRLVETDLRRDPSWPAWVASCGIGQVALRARRAMVSWDFAEARQRPDQLLSRVPASAMRVYERNLRHLVRLARESGVQVCLSTFAHMLQPQMGKEHLEKLRRFPWFHHLSPWRANDALAAMNDTMRKLSQREKTLFVDNDRLMPKDFSLFLDCCHMWPAGCERLARNFCDAIVASGIIDRRPSPH